MSKSIEIQNNPKLVDRLKDISVMKGLSDEEFAAMLQLSTINMYQPGENIIIERYYDNRIYFLISGKVEISKEKQPLKVLSETGETFGEMSVIEGRERSATIRSLEETTCLAIDASFAERLRKDKKLNLLDKIFTEILAHRLRSTTDDYTRALSRVKLLQEENKILRRLAEEIKQQHDCQEQSIINAEKELDDIRSEVEKFQTEL
ncbi:MAG: cyclic nucleotide-binding domain-containing protein [Desulfobulbaceae bacterium]|nr:cyclic nucleotide-binding domain-containing protein [Desulfobulbaceae bacterium]